jgi:hypothetical protein
VGRRYGKVFTLRIATIPPMVYLSDPAEIKKVFAGDPSVFHAGEANAMLSGVLGDSSVLVQSVAVSYELDELGPRRDVEFGVGVGQVGLHCAGRDEQPCRDVLVGQAFAD